MEKYSGSLSTGNVVLDAYRLSYILFGAFLLTASMNRVSVYKNFAVPDLLLSLSFLVVVTGFLIRGFFPANFLIQDNPVWVPGLLFTFSCLLAILFGPKYDLLQSLLVLLQFVFIFFVMAPLFRFQFQKQSPRAIGYIEVIGVLIFISGLFACLVAVLREYIGVSILNANVTRIGRHGSYMGGPGNFSHYLTLIWPFGLHFVLAGSIQKRVLGILGIGLLIWGVSLSASRFAFVAIPLVSSVYLACLALFSKQVLRKFIYLLLTASVVSAIIWAIYLFIQNPGTLKSVISSISISSAMGKKLSQFYAALETGSLASFDPKRAFFTSKALDFLSSIPLVGIGLDNAIHVLGFRVHILPFTIWIEGGILALLSIILIYWKILKSGIANLRKCKNHREVSLFSALFASCAASFLSGVQSPIAIQSRYHWIPYFAVLFLAVFMKTRSSQASNS